MLGPSAFDDSRRCRRRFRSGQSDPFESSAAQAPSAVKYGRQHLSRLTEYSLLDSARGGRRFLPLFDSFSWVDPGTFGSASISTMCKDLRSAADRSRLQTAAVAAEISALVQNRTALADNWRDHRTPRTKGGGAARSDRRGAADGAGVEATPLIKGRRAAQTVLSA